MKISKNWLLVAGVVASAVVLVGTRVLADNAWDIESYTVTNVSAATPVTFDGAGDLGNNQAVVDWILSEPGYFNGHTYSSWSFLVSDASGSMLVYAGTAALASVHYTPTVGDQISASGNWGPYHAIPEMGTPYSSITRIASGVKAGTWVNDMQEVWGDGDVHSTQISTILANGGINNVDGSYGNPHPGGGQNSEPFNQQLAGYVVKIPDVTVGSAGTLNGIFPAGNWTFTITDSGNNSMTMYFWTSSYSVDGEMTGGTIPTWPVDIYGFLTAYPSKLGGTNVWQDEIVPIAFVGIPEPSSFMLAGMGLLSLIAVIRRRRS